MKKINNHILLVAVLLALSLNACSDIENDTEKVKDGSPKFPIINKDQRRLERGKIFGDESISIFGGGKPSNANIGNVVGGVNAYLWRASLDVISFMPLASADAVGGIIITDWYESQSAKNERMKANINISSQELRASGVKVSLFKQRYSGGRWKDSKVNQGLATQLEDKILARARELKISAERR